MSDLISRSALIDSIVHCRTIKGRKTVESFARFINEQPSVDAVPVVRGSWKQQTEWSEDNNAIFECTNCLHGDVQAKGAVVPYCWHCGAKMDGGED